MKKLSASQFTHDSFIHPSSPNPLNPFRVMGSQEPIPAIIGQIWTALDRSQLIFSLWIKFGSVLDSFFHWVMFDWPMVQAIYAQVSEFRFFLNNATLIKCKPRVYSVWKQSVFCNINRKKIWLQFKLTVCNSVCFISTKFLFKEHVISVIIKS